MALKEPDHLQLELFSPYGNQGFPGVMTVRASFTMQEDTLVLEYWAVSDDGTVCSLTNHTYWNLSRHNSGTIDSHVLLVPASQMLETDGENIPTRRVLPLVGTDLDLRESVQMRSVYADHTLLLPEEPEMHLAGRVEEPLSGRWLEVSTDMPAVQVYTADHMAVMSGKNGTVYGPRRGSCLETQFYPDAPNHPQFPSALLRSVEEARCRTCWRFGTK